MTSDPGVTLHNTGVGMFTTASFELHFDPALLQVTGIADPAGGAATIDLTTSGIAAIDIIFDAPVSGDDLELGRLLATIPATAPYRSQQLLDIVNVVVDGDAASVQDDDGVHVAAFIGDTTGEARYSALDAQRIQRVIVRLDTGFGAYPLLDPLIVGDVNATGRLESIDALLIQRHIVRIPVPEIPDLPALPPEGLRSAPDTRAALGRVPAAMPAESVALATNPDTAAGFEQAQRRIAPVIDLRSKPASSIDRATDWASKPWMGDLTTRLGQSSQEANPNARIRIAAAPDAAVSTAASIGRGARF